MKSNDNLVWVDLETTGLDCNSDLILEIALVVTTPTLEVIDSAVAVIGHPQGVLDVHKMSEWVLNQHTKTGLLKEVVDDQTLQCGHQYRLINDFLVHYVYNGTSPMCGSNVCFDRRFIENDMPVLGEFFHYRNLDVSSIKEFVNRMKPELKYKYPKRDDTAHRALPDILRSIDELKYYRKVLLG